MEAELHRLREASILGDLDARRELRAWERRLRPPRPRIRKVPGHRPVKARWRLFWREVRDNRENIPYFVFTDAITPMVVRCFEARERGENIKAGPVRTEAFILEFEVDDRGTRRRYTSVHRRGPMWLSPLQRG